MSAVIRSLLRRVAPGPLLLAALVAAGSALPAAAELSLVMVEQQGCPWCARWNREIAPIYPKTDEGKAAPLRRLDIHAPVPDDLSLDSDPRLTPTFILVDDGTEVGRIEGYPGEDFFWPMLARLIDRAGEAAGARDGATAAVPDIAGGQAGAAGG